jgi:hypothetical protein
VIGQLGAELVQTGEVELHLGLDAGHSDDLPRRRTLLQVVQQGGLPDPGLTAKHQHRTLPGLDRPEEPVERLALAVPATQPLPTVVGCHSRSP